MVVTDKFQCTMGYLYQQEGIIISKLALDYFLSVPFSTGHKPWCHCQRGEVWRWWEYQIWQSVLRHWRQVGISTVLTHWYLGDVAVIFKHSLVIFVLSISKKLPSGECLPFISQHIRRQAIISFNVDKALWCRMTWVNRYIGAQWLHMIFMKITKCCRFHLSPCSAT